MTATTATAAAPSAVSHDDGRSPLAGAATLVRFQLRRDRIKLPAWTAGLGAFVLYVVSALDTILPEDEIADVTALYSGPLGRMLIGPGYGFDDPTHERFVANGYGLYLMLLAALMSILLVVRHTRVEEQSGRAELVRANVVGPHATLAATVVVAVITNLLAAALVVAAMVGVGGFGVGGSLLLAAAIAAVGLAFTGVTVIAVQLSEYSRGAAGIAGAVLGAAFVVRAGGDIAREGGSALSWVSPLGWAQQTAPFVLDRWWPLLLLGAFAVATTAGGFVLSTRRDLGASMVAVRPGPPRARPALGTPFGLALRLGRAGIVGWTAALGVTGLACGAFAQGVLDATDDLPEAFIDLFGAEDLLAGYLAYLAMFMSFLVAVYAVLAIQGMRTEETKGRAGPVLATPVSRPAWLGTNLVVTTVGVLLITAVTGAATGVGAALVTGDAHHVGEVTVAHLNHAPAVFVVLGLAILAFGAFPRAIPVTWAVIGYALVVGAFGPLLDLPQIAFDISPFAHAAEMPVEAFALAPPLVLTAIAAVLTAVGFLALARRDVEGT